MLFKSLASNLYYTRTELWEVRGINKLRSRTRSSWLPFCVKFLWKLGYTGSCQLPMAIFPAKVAKDHMTCYTKIFTLSLYTNMAPDTQGWQMVCYKRKTWDLQWQKLFRSEIAANYIGIPKQKQWNICSVFYSVMETCPFMIITYLLTQLVFSRQFSRTHEWDSKEFITKLLCDLIKKRKVAANNVKRILRNYRAIIISFFISDFKYKHF